MKKKKKETRNKETKINKNKSIRKARNNKRIAKTQ